MENEIMQKYYKYMRESANLNVGTYEVGQLAKECGIDVKILIFLGARANAIQAPVSIKEGWYVYALEERIQNGKPSYYITIDKLLKYL